MRDCVRRNVVTEYWKEMKEKLKEKYRPEYYKNRLLDQLHRLRQSDMSVQNYITKFEDLTLYCDVREHRSQTITRFVWGLRSKIRRVMITDSYDLDTVEEAFDITLRIYLIFKRLVNAKARCPKYEGYRLYDYQCHSESRHIKIVSNDNVDDSRVVKDVNILPEITSIVENTLIDSSTPIINELLVFSDSNRMMWMA